MTVTSKTTSPARWAGAGFSPSDADPELYRECMRQPGHAVAGSRWYRTFQNREALRWLRGEYADARVDVPVRWLHGLGDLVITRLREAHPRPWGGDGRGRRTLDR